MSSKKISRRGVSVAKKGNKNAFSDVLSAQKGDLSARRIDDVCANADTIAKLRALLGSVVSAWIEYEDAKTHGTLSKKHCLKKALAVRSALNARDEPICDEKRVDNRVEPMDAEKHAGDRVDETKLQQLCRAMRDLSAQTIVDADLLSPRFFVESMFSTDCEHLHQFPRSLYLQHAAFLRLLLNRFESSERKTISRSASSVLKDDADVDENDPFLLYPELDKRLSMRLATLRDTLRTVASETSAAVLTDADSNINTTIVSSVKREKSVERQDCYGNATDEKALQEKAAHHDEDASQMKMHEKQRSALFALLRIAKADAILPDVMHYASPSMSRVSSVERDLSLVSANGVVCAHKDAYAFDDVKEDADIATTWLVYWCVVYARLQRTRAAHFAAICKLQEPLILRAYAGEFVDSAKFFVPIVWRTHILQRGVRVHVAELRVFRTDALNDRAPTLEKNKELNERAPASQKELNERAPSYQKELNERALVKYKDVAKHWWILRVLCMFEECEDSDISNINGENALRLTQVRKNWTTQIAKMPEWRSYHYNIIVPENQALPDENDDDGNDVFLSRCRDDSSKSSFLASPPRLFAPTSAPSSASSSAPSSAPSTPKKRAASSSRDADSLFATNSPAAVSPQQRDVSKISRLVKRKRTNADDARIVAATHSAICDTFAASLSSHTATSLSATAASAERQHDASAHVHVAGVHSAEYSATSATRKGEQAIEDRAGRECESAPSKKPKISLFLKPKSEMLPTTAKAINEEEMARRVLFSGENTSAKKSNSEMEEKKSNLEMNEDASAKKSNSEMEENTSAKKSNLEEDASEKKSNSEMEEDASAKNVNDALLRHSSTTVAASSLLSLRSATDAMIDDGVVDEMQDDVTK